jgi:hypothetical protein
MYDFKINFFLTGNISKVYPLIWRFFPALDQQVDVLLVRDLDSQLNQRELDAVNEFMSSKEVNKLNILAGCSASLRNAPQRSATLCNALQRSEALCNNPQRSAVFRNAPQRSATLRNAPQRSTTLRNAPRFHEKKFQKKIPPKKIQKEIPKKIPKKFFLPIFFTIKKKSKKSNKNMPKLLRM